MTLSHSFFDKLGLIENYGTGISRTLDTYKNTEKDPKFYDSENFFIVYLPNLNYHDQINELGLSIIKIANDNLGIKANRIYGIISADEKEITLNIIKNSIERKLKDYIELRGSRETRGYYLKNSNN